jgi:hypothetical protein
VIEETATMFLLDIPPTYVGEDSEEAALVEAQNRQYEVRTGSW